MKTTLLFLFAFSFAAFPQQNFWEQTNGPNGGQVNSLTIDKNGYIFAGTINGVYRSSDNGNNWMQMNNGIISATHFIYTIANDSNGNIFIGVGEGIFRSTNEGVDWVKKNRGIGPKFAYSFAFDSSGNIFAATTYGVFKSTNNGDDWITTSLIGTGAGPIIINKNGYIFAGNSQGIFRSIDDGENWTLINNGLTKVGITFGIFAFAIDSSGNTFVGTAAGIFKTSDNGENWLKIFDGHTECLNINGSGVIFAGGYFGIIRSTDDGDNWSEINNGLISTNVRTLESTLNNKIFVGTTSGIQASTNNGDNWTDSDVGLTASSVYSVAINSKGDIFAETKQKGICKSTDNGNTWNVVFNVKAEIADQSALAINSKDNIFAVLAGQIYRSTDNGENWTNITNEIDNGTRTIAIDKMDNIFVGTEFIGPLSIGGIFRSTDNGDSWIKTNDGLPTDEDTSFQVTCLATSLTGDVIAGTNIGIFISNNNGDTWYDAGGSHISCLAINSHGDIFAGTIYNFVYQGMFRNGMQINNGLSISPGAFAVYSITIDSNDNIFIGTSEGIFNSTNNGDSWNNINSGMNNLNALSFAINPGGYIFVGTQGVYKSVNPIALPVELLSFNGNVINNTIQLKWSTATEINNNGFEIQRKASGVNEKDLAWNTIGFVEGNGTTTEKKTYLYIDKSVSSGKYLYRLKQIDFDGTFTYSKEIEINFSAPLTFSLSQNYPNPFNPSTTIKYSLPEDSNVKLTLINSLGEKVMDLVNGKVNAGNHEVKLNGSNLASGIYFYRIETGKYTATKKLILLK